MAGSPAGASQAWVVVGAGVAGLLAARRLASMGAAVTLLEASDAVGGRTSSIELDGLTLDAGAEAFATRGGSVAALAEELGLGDQIVVPADAPAWIVGPEREYPLPRTGWLGIPVQPFARDVRRVIGWRGAVRAQSDSWRPARAVSDDVTVGALVRRRMGRAVAERLVAPVVAGVYSRSIDELETAAVAPGLAAEVRRQGGLIAAVSARRAAAPAGSAVQGIRGGMHRLAVSLADGARHAGVQIRTGARVTSVKPAAAGWAVHVGEERLKADGVVLAVPLAAASELMPGLAAPAQEWVALVTLVLDKAALRGAPRGTGVLATGGVTRAKALTHATAKWEWLAHATGGHHVLRLSYAVDGPGVNVTDHAVRDAGRLLGVTLADAHVRALGQRVWPDAAPVADVDVEPMPGLHLVGSAAGLSGLAAIVAADGKRPLTTA